MMLSKSWNVPIPALVDDEYLSNAVEGRQPKGRPCTLGLFVSSCGLFELLEEILSSFYSAERTSDSALQSYTSDKCRELVEPVLQFNRRLDRFIDSVPKYLRISSNACPPPSNDKILQLQQQVLYCR